MKDQEAVDEMQTDVDILLECLKYQTRDFQGMKRSLQALAAVFNSDDEAKEYFRKVGGLELVQELLSERLPDQVLQAAVYCLACAVENDVFCQNTLTTRDTMDYVHMVLSEKTGDRRWLHAAVFLTLNLVANNSAGQRLAKESSVLADLINIFRHCAEACGSDRAGSQEDVELWMSVVTALSMCVNNPQNESNQRLCATLLPLCFQAVVEDRWRPLTDSLLSFAGLTVSGNEWNQKRVRTCGGLDTLLQLTDRWGTQGHDDPSLTHTAQAALTVLNAAITDNEENSALFVVGCGVEMVMRMVKGGVQLSPHNLIQLLLTLGHALEHADNNVAALTGENQDILVQLLTDTDDEEVVKALKYVLTTWQALGERDTVCGEREGKKTDLTKRINRLASHLISMDTADQGTSPRPYRDSRQSRETDTLFQEPTHPCTMSRTAASIVNATPAATACVTSAFAEGTTSHGYHGIDRHGVPISVSTQTFPLLPPQPQPPLRPSVSPPPPPQHPPQDVHTEPDGKCIDNEKGQRLWQPSLTLPANAHQPWLTLPISCQQTSTAVVSANHSTYPSWNDTQHPSVTSTQHPSWSKVQHPSWSNVQHPSVTDTQHPAWNNVQHPSATDIQHPSWSNLLHSSVTDTHHPSWNNSQHPSIPVTQHPSWNNTQHPSVTDTHHPSWSNLQHPSVTDTHRPSWNKVQHPSINNTQHPSWNNCQHPSVTDTHNPSWNNSQHPSIPDTQHPSWSDTQHPSWSKVHYQSVTDTQHSPWSNAQNSSVTNTHHPSVIGAQHPSVTNTCHSSWSNVQRPSMTATHHPSVISTQHPSITDTYHPSWSNIQHPSMTDTCHPSVTDTHHPSVTDTHHPSVTDIHHPSVTDTHHQSVTDTHHPSVTDTHHPSVTDTHHPSVTNIHHPSVTDTHRPSVTEVQQLSWSNVHTQHPSVEHTKHSDPDVPQCSVLPVDQLVCSSVEACCYLDKSVHPSASHGPVRSVVPTSQTHLSVLPTSQTHLSVSPISHTHLSVLPTSQTHLSVFPTSQTHLSASHGPVRSVVPTSQTHLSEVPTSQTHLSEVPTSQIHLSVLPTSQTHLSASHAPLQPVVPTSQTSVSSLPATAFTTPPSQCSLPPVFPLSTSVLQPLPSPPPPPPPLPAPTSNLQKKVMCECAMTTNPAGPNSPGKLEEWAAFQSFKQFVSSLTASSFTHTHQVGQHDTHRGGMVQHSDFITHRPTDPQNHTCQNVAPQAACGSGETAQMTDISQDSLVYRGQDFPQVSSGLMPATMSVATAHTLCSTGQETSHTVCPTQQHINQTICSTHDNVYALPYPCGDYIPTTIPSTSAEGYSHHQLPPQCPQLLTTTCNGADGPSCGDRDKNESSESACTPRCRKRVISDSGDTIPVIYSVDKQLMSDSKLAAESRGEVGLSDNKLSAESRDEVGLSYSQLPAESRGEVGLPDNKLSAESRGEVGLPDNKLSSESRGDVGLPDNKLSAESRGEVGPLASIPGSSTGPDTTQCVSAEHKPKDHVFCVPLPKQPHLGLLTSSHNSLMYGQSSNDTITTTETSLQYSLSTPLRKGLRRAPAKTPSLQQYRLGSLVKRETQSSSRPMEGLTPSFGVTATRQASRPTLISDSGAGLYQGRQQWSCSSYCVCQDIPTRHVPSPAPSEFDYQLLKTATTTGQLRQQRCPGSRSSEFDYQLLKMATALRQHGHQRLPESQSSERQGSGLQPGNTLESTSMMPSGLRLGHPFKDSMDEDDAVVDSETSESDEVDYDMLRHSAGSHGDTQSLSHSSVCLSDVSSVVKASRQSEWTAIGHNKSQCADVCPGCGWRTGVTSRTFNMAIESSSTTCSAHRIVRQIERDYILSRTGQRHRQTCHARLVHLNTASRHNSAHR